MGGQLRGAAATAVGRFGAQHSEPQCVPSKRNPGADAQACERQNIDDFSGYTQRMSDMQEEITCVEQNSAI